ncbi:MAG: hypothetical protein H7836_16920 [Magnetococcus sp. YQC-3]
MGYVLTEKAANDFETNTIQKVTVLIPENTKVLKLNTGLYTETSKNETLVEFVYVDDVTDYIETYQFNEENPEFNFNTLVFSGIKTVTF